MEEQISNLLEKEEIEALLCPERYTQSTGIFPTLQNFFSTHGFATSPSQASSNNAYIASTGQFFLSFSDTLCQMLIDKTLGGKTTLSNQPFKLGTIGEKIISNFAAEIINAITDNEYHELSIEVEQTGVLSIYNTTEKQADNFIYASLNNLSVSQNEIVAGSIIPLNIPKNTKITLNSKNISVASGIMGRKNDTIAIKITSVNKSEL